MVIVDTGHGYDTYGKASPVWSDGTQLFEWEFNRTIARRIQERLGELMIKSILLVPEAIDVRLTVRCERANEIWRQFPGAFLISIHGNAAERPGEGSGWEVWTSPGETESDKLATCLFEAAKIHLPEFRMRTDWSDGDADKEARFTILTGTSCPAALTENLFYDNERDCRFMMSEQGQRAITELHIEGITNFLKTRT